MLDILKSHKLTLQMKVHPDYARGSRKRNLPVVTKKKDKLWNSAFDEIVSDLRAYLELCRQTSCSTQNRHIICNVFANDVGRIGTVELTSDENAVLRCCEGYTVCDTGSLLAAEKAKAARDALINSERAVIANASCALLEKFASTVMFAFENTGIRAMPNVEVSFDAKRCAEVIRMMRDNQTRVLPPGQAPTPGWSYDIPKLRINFIALGMNGRRMDSVEIYVDPRISMSEYDYSENQVPVRFHTGFNSSVTCDRPEYLNEIMMILAQVKSMIDSINELHPTINEELHELRSKWNEVPKLHPAPAV